MPGEDGLSLARWIRAGNMPTGIIFATAAGASIDRIIGLELGADDYIVKPYELRELLARVRSVIRRLPAASAEPVATPAAAETKPASGKRVRFGGNVLDLEARSLSDPNGRPIDLTADRIRPSGGAGHAGMAVAVPRPDHRVLRWRWRRYGPGRGSSASSACGRRSSQTRNRPASSRRCANRYVFLGD